MKQPEAYAGGLEVFLTVAGRFLAADWIKQPIFSLIYILERKFIELAPYLIFIVFLIFLVFFTNTPNSISFVLHLFICLASSLERSTYQAKVYQKRVLV
jgi:hypothetical protein